MKRVLIFIICATALQLAQADTLLVERGQRAEAATLPLRGSRMTHVESQFGAPLEKREAVGEPPITRWIYPAFTVYFEHRHVISSVLNKSARNELGPKPAQ